MHSRLRHVGLVLSLAAVGIATGCVSQDQIDAQRAVTDYYIGNYAEAKQLLTPLAKKTNEDFVLNNARLGSTTLAMYDLASSQAAFLQAYEVLNSYGVNNGGRTLGAVLVDERLKIWRGEPFERAMANFYLGLIYYMQGDYNNARGAFENALFKLRDYEEGDSDKAPDPDKYAEVDSNFILAQYMLARCYQRLGQDDLAAANFGRAVKLRPQLRGLADPSYNSRSNVLLVIDFGEGPRKVADGDGAIVGFSPTPDEAGPVPRPMIAVDGRGQNLRGLDEPLIDLVALAQDRKWQSIDTIRTVKSVVGTGLIVGGGITALSARDNTTAGVGLGLLAAGLLLKATSQADTRVWETLPRSTFVIPLTLSPGTHDVSVAFPAAGGMRQTWHGLQVPATGEATFYFRLQSMSSSDNIWPPMTLTGWPYATPQPPTAVP